MSKVSETQGCRSKKTCNLSPSKETTASTEDCKKAMRRERCRINQANFRKRKREKKLQLIAKAQEIGQLKETENLQVKVLSVTTKEWKIARRREKCRIYQLNYLKRKRLLEEQLMREVNVLNQELWRLKAIEASASQQYKGQFHPMQPINDFYYELRHEIGQLQLPDVKKYQSTYGCSPALEVLLDLQREEFGSVESLRLHWLWYRTQFKEFTFSIGSCERLETTGGVIVKITGKLRLGIYCDNKEGEENDSTYDTIVCPVLQQFEIDAGGQAAARITSEVGLVEGVITSQGHGDLKLAPKTLHSLSERFCRSNSVTRLTDILHDVWHMRADHIK